MEKSETLKDDDQDEENRCGHDENDRCSDEHEDNGRPVRVKLPGMVIPHLESIKGSVGIKY